MNSLIQLSRYMEDIFVHIKTFWLSEFHIFMMLSPGKYMTLKLMHTYTKFMKGRTRFHVKCNCKSVLFEIISYAYTQEIEINLKNITVLLIGANILQMEDLLQKLVRYIRKR